MRLFWKIAVSVGCVAMVGGTAILWSGYRTKAKEQILLEQARACRVRADQGDAKAEYDLGRMYQRGEGVQQDYVEAVRWYRKSADQAYAKAEYGIGYMYRHGLGVPQDDAEATRWFVKAVDQGDALAECELGFLHEHGIGVEQDDAKSIYWYRKSAEQGYATAESALGFMYFYGRGVPVDRAEANRWFRKAADQGDEYALRTISKPLTTEKKFFLLVQLIAGLILSTGFLSLNIFEPGNSLRNFRQRVTTGTGILCLLSAGLGWYGYTHYKIRSLAFGFNMFTCIKWLLDGVTFALLVYIVSSKKKPAEDEIAVRQNAEQEYNDK